MRQFTVGRGDTALEVYLVMVGQDMSIAIYGGVKPHIGAVAVAVPRPSLRGDGKTSATTSVYNLVGHKDDEIAKPVAEQVAAATNRVVTVAAGFHLDNITPTQIKECLANIRQAVARIISLAEQA